MSRNVKNYNCRPLANLVMQLLFTPKDKRQAQILRAEKLHDQLDPNQNYPFDFINFRITGYHSETEAQNTTIVVGEAVLPDLRLLIDALSHSSEAPVEEPIFELKDLAAKWHVSTRTIHRWRQIGLRWRWFINEKTGRYTRGFTQSAIDRFLKDHAKRVADAGRYRYLTDAERQTLLARAQELHQATGGTLNQVAAMLVKECQWSLQTLRHLLEQNDANNTNDPLFIDHTGPLTSSQCRQIARSFHQGVSLETLCEQYHRTVSTLRRAMVQNQMALLNRVPLAEQHFEAFDDPDASERFLHPDPAPDHWQPAPPIQSQLPPLLNVLFRQPVLSPALLHQMLTSYHFLKYRAALGRLAFKPHVTKMAQITAVRQDIARAGRLRDEIVRANLHTVLAVACNHLTGHDRHSQRLLHLLIAGNAILFEAVEQVDPLRNQAFESFLKWRLQRAFAQQMGEHEMASQAVRRLTPQQANQMMRTAATRQGIRLPPPPPGISPEIPPEVFGENLEESDQ